MLPAFDLRLQPCRLFRHFAIFVFRHIIGYTLHAAAAAARFAAYISLIAVACCRQRFAEAAVYKKCIFDALMSSAALRTLLCIAAEVRAAAFSDAYAAIAARHDAMRWRRI